MKKLLKIIPLLVLPLALSSCSIINSFVNGGEQEQGQTTNTVYPTSLTIEGSTSINVGDSVSLKAIYSPTKVTYSTVTWSSSNESIATVTSRGQVTGKATGNVTITASMKGKNNTTVKATHQMSVSKVSPKEKGATTVMIYMCGADLESENGLATMDLDEILSVNNQPDDVNIIVETGGAKSWKKSQIPTNKLARWEISKRQFIKKQELTYASMGLPGTLQSFMEWGFQNYPADKYGLILWNHGGAMDGCCFDEKANNDSLTADEVYNAVKTARSNKGIANKLEWITYDACLMAVQDVAEYNSYNFNYMLSSQESEAGYGYDYDAWLPSLYNNPSINGGDLLEVIGHTFLVEEKALYAQEGWGACDQTQSVYDLSKMSAYKTAFESIASDLNSIIGTSASKAASLGNLIANGREYGLNEYGESSGFEIFDMKEALNKVKANTTFSSISSKVTSFYNKLDDLVIYEEHGEGTTGCGICIFSPCRLSIPYSYSGTTYIESNFTEWKKVSNKIWPELYENWAD